MVNNLEFFKSLDYDNPIEVVEKICSRFKVQYGTTLGLDGHPQIRPIEFKFAKDGKLYFDTVTFYNSYKELCAHPYLQICVCDEETMTYLRVGGKVNFTNDKEIIDTCFEKSEVLTSQFGNNREVVIGYYLSDAWVEICSFSKEIQNQKYTL